MNELIIKKRQELIDECRKKCESFLSVISSPTLSNKSYKSYIDGLNEIHYTAGRVLDFNAAMDEFFTV